VIGFQRCDRGGARRIQIARSILDASLELGIETDERLIGRKQFATLAFQQPLGLAPGGALTRGATFQSLLIHLAAGDPQIGACAHRSVPWRLMMNCT
jgi:hypothetical protein